MLSSIVCPIHFDPGIYCPMRGLFGVRVTRVTRFVFDVRVGVPHVIRQQSVKVTSVVNVIVRHYRREVSW